MTAPAKAEHTAAPRQSAIGLILLGVLLTGFGVVWAVMRGGVAIPMITGPVCLIAGIAQAAKRKPSKS